MKKINEIINKKRFLEKQLKRKEEVYAKLDQISMQSDEGTKMLEEINKIKGSLLTLKWLME